MPGPSLAVEIELQRGFTENLGAGRRIGHAFSEPVDRRPIRELALVADERAIAGPYQTVGTGGAQKLARVGDRGRAEPIATGCLHPRAAFVDRAQQCLETIAVDAVTRIGAAE